MKRFLKLHQMVTSLGLITILATPTLFFVACGSKKNKTSSFPKYSLTEYKVDNVKPLVFNKIFNNATVKANEPIFSNGINYTAYTQGMSLIFNILQGLGWHWEDEAKIKKLYGDFNFDAIRPGRTNNSKINIDHNAFNAISNQNKINKFEADLTNAFVIHYEKGLNQFLTKKADHPPQSKLYNQIRFLEVINKEANNFDKVDCTTEVKIDLGSGFKDLELAAKFKLIANKLNTKEIATKLFGNKKYAYTWEGTLLRKFGFQLQTRNGSTIMLLWQLSDGLPQIYKNLRKIRTKNNQLQQLFDHSNQLQQQDRKNLSQVLLDPLGVDGTMPPRFFFTNTNLKHTNNLTSATTYFRESINAYDQKNDLYDWSNGQDVKLEKQHVSSYNSFLDARDPGKVVLKMYSGKGMETIAQTLMVDHPLQTLSTSNRIQTFYELKDAQKITQMADLSFRFIRFLQAEARLQKQEIRNIEKIVSPLVRSLFEFLRNNDIAKNDVITQFKRCNNGSHYMLGVEIFFRGLTSIPTSLITNFQLPLGMKLYLGLQNGIFKRKSNEIVGMVNVNNIFPILYLTYTSSKANTSSKYYNFDPEKSDYSDDPVDFIANFIEDQTSNQKNGVEIKLYKL